jgi:lipopolysaccharide biosynthesis protein
VGIWRQWAEENGYGGLYLAAVRSFDITDPRPYGFDAAVEFPPHQIEPREVTAECRLVNPAYSGRVVSYPDIAAKFLQAKEMPYTLFKGVMPGWDNEARKPGAGISFVGNTPEGFRNWVAGAVQALMRNRPEERLLFVNAWNEWAEGAHLEPDRKHGYAYLEALADGVRGGV